MRPLLSGTGTNGAIRRTIFDLCMFQKEGGQAAVFVEAADGLVPFPFFPSSRQIMTQARQGSLQGRLQREGEGAYYCTVGTVL